MQESIPLGSLFPSLPRGLVHQGRIAGLGMNGSDEESFQPGPGLSYEYMNPPTLLS